MALTGAGGFLGRHVAARLAEAGYSVRRLSYRTATDGTGTLLPPVNAPENAFRDAVRGAAFVVHCAAMNNDTRNPDPALLEASNVELPARLARAAADEGVGRFLLLSSTRAVAGASDSLMIDEKTEPRPRCAYGRSKRAAELAVLDVAGPAGGFHPIVLRLPPAHGHGMRGNLALLMRIARTGWPLPLAGIAGSRSLVSAGSVASAVTALLDAETLASRIYLAADDGPVSPAEIIRAFRRGFGLAPRLFSVPNAVLRLAARSLGKGEIWENLGGSQVCDPSALVAEGWTPRNSTAALEALAAEIRGVESRG